jgi:hypothetical protein
MPLSLTDLAALGDTPVTILSTYFANVYLRMDGTGVTAVTGPGGGTVNCAYNVGAWEQFRVRPQIDGSYAFESVAFPNVMALWLHAPTTDLLVPLAPSPIGKDGKAMPATEFLTDLTELARTTTPPAPA